MGSPDQSIFLGSMLLCLAGIGTIVILKKGSNNIVQRQSEQITKPALLRQSLLFSQRYGVFYIAMAGFAFWLSFGMALTPVDTTGLGIYRVIAWLSPYNLLYQFVPGFSSIRSPYRFSIFCALFLSVLAGWGMLWLSQRVRAQWRAIIVPLLVAAVLLELWPLPLRLVKIPTRVEELPRIYQHVKKLPAAATLIELPLARGPSEQQLETEARSMYFSTFHWLSLANGYSGFFPRAKSDLKKIIAESDPEMMLSAFKTFGIQYVLTHEGETQRNRKNKVEEVEREWAYSSCA